MYLDPLSRQGTAPDGPPLAPADERDPVRLAFELDPQQPRSLIKDFIWNRRDLLDDPRRPICAKESAKSAAAWKARTDTGTWLAVKCWISDSGCVEA